MESVSKYFMVFPNSIVDNATFDNWLYQIILICYHLSITDVGQVNKKIS